MLQKRVEELFEEFYESATANHSRGQFMLMLYEAFAEGYQKGFRDARILKVRAKPPLCQPSFPGECQ